MKLVRLSVQQHSPAAISHNSSARARSAPDCGNQSFQNADPSWRVGCTRTDIPNVPVAFQNTNVVCTVQWQAQMRRRAFVHLCTIRERRHPIGRMRSLVQFRALIAKPPGQADKALWSPPTGPGAIAPPSARRALARALFEAGVPTCAPSALPAVPCIPTWNVMGRRCAVAWPRRRVLGRCGRRPRAARYPARRGQQPRARRNSLICSVNRPFTCGDCLRVSERAVRRSRAYHGSSARLLHASGHARRTGGPRGCE